MSTATTASLRDILLDSLEDAFWYRRATIEGCVSCSRNPAGICADHSADNDAAFFYEDARKRLEQTPNDPEVLAIVGSIEGAIQ